MASQDIDIREQQLFQSLDLDNDQRVTRSDLANVLAVVGLNEDDYRLADSMTALDFYEKNVSAPDQDILKRGIPKDSFCRAIRHNILLIERALQGNMVIPDFTQFCAELEEIYDATHANRSGHAADYIPQLNLSEPEVDQYGIAICTVDGQCHSVGDAHAFFSVQSTCKPINYCLALEEHGEDRVHAHVGHEPSGLGFNELTLNKHNRPHNPMINAGAIMSSSLIKLKDKRQKKAQGEFSEMDVRGWAGRRFDHVMRCWEALCGGEKPRFSNSVYLSERQTADRNFALAYYMREKGAFPEDIDLHDALDFYFQCCAIEMNADMMSKVAATLANGGICPVSGVRVFQTDTVKNCLSMMSCCGMYDFSGEFAFSIGLPAKSGVSGALLIVIPNVMGICTWSPRLDEHGNSVRGIDFCQRLVKTFNFHNYDNLTNVSGKKDPRLNRIQDQASQVNGLIWAASKGDLSAIQQQVWRGAELNCADYDLRSPLHLAAAEGQANVVAFFIDQKRMNVEDIELNPRDRWGNTPLDDAYIQGHDTIIEMLKEAGGVRGHNKPLTSGAPVHVPPAAQSDPLTTTELILAASMGDLQAIRRLVARGVALGIADYDLRTPLHLAAAEGHLQVVEYFIAQGVEINPRDRWANTPLDDAFRHGQKQVAELLKTKGGQQGGDQRLAVCAD